MTTPSTSDFIANIEALIARYAGTDRPAIQAMIASYQNSIKLTEAALGDIAAVVVNDMTDGLPDHELIQAVLDPAVTGVVNIAGPAFWNLFDHGLTQTPKPVVNNGAA